MPAPRVPPEAHRVSPVSKPKVVHILHIRHRDEVEPPITDWPQEAYDWAGAAKPN